MVRLHRFVFGKSKEDSSSARLEAQSAHVGRLRQDVQELKSLNNELLEWVNRWHHHIDSIGDLSEETISDLEVELNDIRKRVSSFRFESTKENKDLIQIKMGLLRTIAKLEEFVAHVYDHVGEEHA